MSFIYSRPFLGLLLAGSLVLALAQTPALSAPDEVPAGQKKDGFFSRLFTSDKDKDKAAAAPAAPPVKPTASKSKPAEAPAKPKQTASSKPKSSNEASPAAKTPAASERKAPTLTLKKTRDTGKPNTAPATSKPQPSKPAVASSDDKPSKPKTTKPVGESLDAAFGKATPKPASPTPATASVPAEKPSPASAEKPAPAAVPSSAASIAPPLPSNTGWDVVKYNGRDYVTAESIQRFFRFATLKRTGNHVWFNSTTVIMKAEIGSQELLINSIKFILSNPVEESDGKAMISRVDLCKLIDPVLRPSYITTSAPFDTVVLDAGHGGHDSGARGVYGFEKDFTLQMALAVRTALKNRGIKVLMTRDTDVFIPLHGRVEKANEIPNSILVSLHFNSGGSSATGIETFALSPQGSSSTFMGERGWDTSSFTGNRQDSENIALATAVHAMVINKFKIIDRGIKRARFTVLTGCLRPGILFEGGFVTNPTECRLIAADNYRQLLANTIADGILNYRKALQPRVGASGR
jgi:N-acetylmuramoyl-L-alanine amidase